MLQAWSHLAESYAEAWSRFNPSVPPEAHALRFHATDGRLVAGVLVAHAVVALLLAAVAEAAGPFSMAWARGFLGATSAAGALLSAFMLSGAFTRDGFGVLCSNSFPGRVMPVLQRAVYVFYLTRLWQLQEPWVAALRHGWSGVALSSSCFRVGAFLLAYASLRLSGGGDEWFVALLGALFDALAFSAMLLHAAGSRLAPAPSSIRRAFVAAHVAGLAHNLVTLTARCGTADALKAAHLAFFAFSLWLFRGGHVAPLAGLDRPPAMAVKEGAKGKGGGRGVAADVPVDVDVGDEEEEEQVGEDEALGDGDDEEVAPPAPEAGAARGGARSGHAHVE